MSFFCLFVGKQNYIILHFLPEISPQSVLTACISYFLRELWSYFYYCYYYYYYYFIIYNWVIDILSKRFCNFHTIYLVARPYFLRW